MKVGFVAAAACAALASVLALPPAAGGVSGNGAAQVTISAPVGVPVNVLLVGKTEYLAAKSPNGSSDKVALAMPSGAYHVNLPRVTFGGAVYIGKASRPEVVIRAGETTALDVTYAAEDGSRALHATKVSQTALSLAWTAPEGSRFSLRRTDGAVPADRRSEGVEVPTRGTEAVDQGLAPGRQYSYALFTQHKSRWYGPLSVVAGTVPVPGSTQASYLISPSTLLAKPSDIVSATSTGEGVRLTLRDGVHTPLLGAGVVLPISGALPGGFLGVVTTASSDGHTVDLTAGGLSDAFDYYEIAVDEFASEAAPPSAKSTSSAGGKAAAAVKCGGSGSQTVTFSPGLSLAGHFKTKIDKYGVFGASIPVGASMDMGLAATVTGAAAVETTGEFHCGLDLGKVFRTLTVSPVPISVSFTPTAQFSVSGGQKVSNLGLAATAGVQVAGTLSLKNGASFSGSPIMNVTPLVPKVTANGSVGLTVGGELVLGPGVGTSNAGVIAGLGGELDPVDATFEPYFAPGDPRYNACTRTTVAFSRSLNLTAKAWIGDWDVTKKVTVDALTGSTPYLGSPWYLPGDCKNLPGSETPDTLLGSGVTKIDEVVAGASGQWGHTDGFVPGKKTWVLSTGLISDAVGTPGQFASTDLGREGDQALTALAGYPTFDAASYQVEIVPDGSTLHVRYVFASEEYPEFVGSSFNDVMAVWVNGTNCATVPGTDQPVSINTINDKQNDSYYVDNSAGAAGYSTSMDGLTTPLTCTMPVTPGKPVTVTISVADTSDHAFDTAVALVDGGIWAD